MAASPADVAARPGSRLVLAGVVGVVLAGVALRLGTRSDLWLDEALSVNIARLPLDQLVDALRRDGHPPLYYLVLHGWMQLFGDGDEAVRLLSGALALVTLPLIWVAGRRYGGRVAGVAALVLLATNPFAIRYATEARMYALVMLLVVAGWLAVREAQASGSRLALIGVALTSGLLLLTHYWSFYLVGATAALLAWQARRGSGRARRALAAVAVGSLLFLPWLPAFLDQAGSTGTPWGRPARPTSLVTVTLADWGGGMTGEGLLLGAVIAVLALFALVARPRERALVEVDFRTRPHARPEAAVVAVTVGLACIGGYATASAFASRYTASVFPLTLLLAAYGVTRLPSTVLQSSVLAGLAALGLVGGVENVRSQRTQGGEMARYIAANGQAGDVVAFCPDQLGPSVARVLPAGFDMLTYPDAERPEFVNWVDYADRQRAGDPVEFAELVHERADDATVWLVWSGGYRTLDDRCETVADALRAHRPGGTAVVISDDEFEHGWLYQYGPVP